MKLIANRYKISFKQKTFDIGTEIMVETAQIWWWWNQIFRGLSSSTLFQLNVVQNKFMLGLLGFTTTRNSMHYIQFNRWYYFDNK